MPTQLKIVVEDGYVQNAPFTVNFAAPVIINPKQIITLDKFVATINGITTGFTVLETQFRLYVSLNSPNLDVVTILFDGGYYATVADLLLALTASLNNYINGYNPAFLPAYGLTRYYRDYGLKVACVTNNNNFQIEYVTCPKEELVLTSSNVSPDTNGYFSPDGNGLFDMNQSDTTKYLCQGGGCLIEFQVRVPTVVQGLAKNVAWFAGLVDDLQREIGIGSDGDGILKLYGGTAPIIVAVADFPNYLNTFIQIYQGNGLFILRSFRRDIDTGEEFPIYNSNDASVGGLGACDYTQQYHFEYHGNMGNIAGNVALVPSLGPVVNMSVDVPFGTLGTGDFSRTMALDMTDAAVLRAGLDIPAGIIYLTPNNSPYGSYTSTNPINMSIINSTFDIAIEILDLPLQTYQASSSGYPGQRNNVVAYFRPELSSVGTSVYQYSSSCYQWLDIDITYPVNLSSMSFRVYNPETGIDINAQNMSFNLMISEKEY